MQTLLTCNPPQHKLMQYFYTGAFRIVFRTNNDVTFQGFRATVTCINTSNELAFATRDDGKKANLAAFVSLWGRLNKHISEYSFCIIIPPVYYARFRSVLRRTPPPPGINILEILYSAYQIFLCLVE